MGAEDFRVRVKSDLDRVHVDASLVALGFHADGSYSAVQGERFWRHDGAEHIIECETAAASGVSLTLRFALCQSPNVDSVFSELVLRVAAEVTGTVIIAEDIDPADPLIGGAFGPPNWNGLASAILQCIVRKRYLWQADFGPGTARLSCREAIDHFIIARDADLGTGAAR